MQSISWVDGIEKGARVLLWLSIASVCVLVPIGYIGQKRTETEAEIAMREALKNAEAKVEGIEKANAPHRLSLASMGTWFSAINYTTAEGSLWFTNVSPRAGTLCVVGMAQDPELSMKTATSLPACLEVRAYASGVHVSFMFAGSDLTTACPKSNCRLTFKEAPEGKE
jgi:hypothetical protein